MSTLENLRFYVEGRTVCDRENPDIEAIMPDSAFARDAAALFNESPTWAKSISWDKKPQFQGNPT